MKDHQNPLLCDIETGLCELPASKQMMAAQSSVQAITKPIKVIYFTDPICSSCWGIEPQLRKLKLEYNDIIDLEYRMGGLLPDWSYNSGGISKPSDVAHHWDEVSAHYKMPIDGDVWLEDPLDSSYPPSIAFKAAQLQDGDKAIVFLREIREMVFLQKKNITRWEHLEAAAIASDLNVQQLKEDYEGKARDLFDEDLKLAKEMGVRGFPSMFFIDAKGQKEFVYGSKQYTVFEAAIHKLIPSVGKSEYNRNWQALFSKYPSLTLREFSELSGMDVKQSEELLNEMTMKKKLEQYTTKNGSIWILK